MVLTNFKQYEMAMTHEFIKSVQMAAVKAAIAIANEDPATPGHAERANFAVQVLHNPEVYAQRMAFGIASLLSDEKQASDSNVNAQVAAVWNAYAGVVKAG